MKTIEDYIEDYFKEFRGKGSDIIVRKDKKEDAFEVVVLDVLYKDYLNLNISSSNVEEISRYIIAPPDRGIDIFVEKNYGDEVSFDVIQVKTNELSETEIRDAFNKMERCIDDFCKESESISPSCRKVLGESALSPKTKDSCNYFVVHFGELDSISKQHDNETIITKSYLEELIKNPYEWVEQDIIKLAKDSSFMVVNKDKSETAIVCNVNAKELIQLNRKYYRPQIGRNILFGYNLRDSLNYKTKETASCAAMRETIENDPEKFWFYNNGITIIADDYSISEKSSDNNILELKRFSIVNGAQTTSSLGRIYDEAKNTRNEKILNNISKVNVLTRVLKVKGNELKQAIAVSNNTQNPITSRDMVTNNKEQNDLYKRLLENEPKIYMEIRRGRHAPVEMDKTFKHRFTKNEILAQLAFAGFYKEPYNAKDKKSLLFARDFSQKDFLINEFYARIFDESDKGILFQKSNKEIDELLFVQQIYQDCRKYAKNYLQDLLENASTDNAKTIYNGYIDIVTICLYYFVATYYKFLEQFGSDFANKSYDYESYYNTKSQYRKQLIEKFTDLFLLKTTVKIIYNTAKTNNKTSNVANWVRGEKIQTFFFDELEELFATDISLSESYKEIMNAFKIN